MGQKGSHSSQEQINEYYERRHSFHEKPEERKVNLDKGPGSNTKHKKSKSKDLTAKGTGFKHKQKNAEVSLQFPVIYLYTFQIHKPIYYLDSK
jgi:hypothetical protein